MHGLQIGMIGKNDCPRPAAKIMSRDSTYETLYKLPHNTYSL